MAEHTQYTDAPPPRQEVYAHGYSAGVLQRQEGRRAEHDAAFLLPHLRAGMSLLDCGCGPGSITVGLAKLLAPGQVVGIDMEADVIARAKRLGLEHGVANLTFEVASTYTLPFPAETFDAVLAHTLLEHVPDPMRALAEMQRVLKPGGVIGVRDLDTRGILCAPEDAPLPQLLTLVAQQVRYNGGDPHCGSRLGTLLRTAGFVGIEIAATYSKKEPSHLANIYTPRLLHSTLTTLALEQGWADQQSLEDLASALQVWITHPDAFCVLSRCHAVGWKA